MKRSDKRTLKQMIGQFRGGDFTRPPSLSDPVPDWPIDAYIVKLVHSLPQMTETQPGKSKDAKIYSFDGSNLNDTGLTMDVYNYTYEGGIVGTFVFVEREPISGLYFAIGRAAFNTFPASFFQVLNCVYPGSDISASGCLLCPCSADPWVLCVDGIACSDGYSPVVIGGCFALFFSSGSDEECQWASEVDDNGYNFILTVFGPAREISHRPAQIELVWDGITTKALWKIEQLCCTCSNCFDLQCPYTIPVCSNLPSRICLEPPVWKPNLTTHGIEDGTNTNCWALCPGPVPEVYLIEFPDGPNAWDIVAGCDHNNQGSAAAHLAFLHSNDCLWQLGCSAFEVFQLNIAIVYPNTLPGNCELIVDIINVFSPEQTVVYTIDAADWDCEGENILTTADDHEIPQLGNTVKITPAGALRTIDGKPVLDKHGNPIYPQNFEQPCDPNLILCSCVFITGEDHTWHWSSGGDGNIIGCEESSCDSSHCPDPSMLPIGSTCSFHTYGH